jgi:hypothetical protein
MHADRRLWRNSVRASGLDGTWGAMQRVALALNLQHGQQAPLPLPLPLTQPQPQPQPSEAGPMSGPAWAWGEGLRDRPDWVHSRLTLDPALVGGAARAGAGAGALFAAPTLKARQRRHPDCALLAIYQVRAQRGPLPTGQQARAGQARAGVAG